MASTHIPDDMKFINMAMEASRPDGKPFVPIWITTVETVVCVDTVQEILIIAVDYCGGLTLLIPSVHYDILFWMHVGLMS